MRITDGVSLRVSVMGGDGRALKEALLKEYKHFADKRIKYLDASSVFIVDDRT